MPSGLYGASRYNQRQFNAGEDAAPPLTGGLRLNAAGELMVNPNVRVEVCLDDPGTWTDWVYISDRVILPGIQVTRGRNSELDRFQAGTATLQVRNHDGYFGPSGKVPVNLIENPSFETGIIGYTGTVATIARSAAGAVPYLGDYGLSVTTTDVILSGVVYDPVTPMLVTPGLFYTFSVHAARAFAADKGVSLWIRWYDVDDVLLSGDSRNHTMGSTTYARFSVAAEAPVGAHHAKPAVQTTGNGLGVFTFYLDALQFEVYPLTITNLIENSSFEADTNGYTANLASMVRSNSGAQVAGSWGLIVTTTNVTASGVSYGDAMLLPVTVGLPYSFIAALSLAVAGSKAMGVYIVWYTAADAFISTSAHTFTLTSTTPTFFNVTGTAPATAHHARLFVQTNGAAGIFDFLTDAWQFEQAATFSEYQESYIGLVLDYIDGDQTNGLWTGAPHASTSTFGDEYSPNQRPMNRLRIINEWDNIDYPVIDGFVDDWTPEYPGPNEAILNLRVTDAFGVFAIQTLQDQPDHGIWGLLVSTTNTNDSGVNYGGPGVLLITEGESYTAKCSAALVIHGVKLMDWLIVFYDATGSIRGYADSEVRLTSEAFARFTVSGTAPTGTTYAKVSFHTSVADGSFDFWLDALHLANDLTPNDNEIANPGFEADTTGYTALSSTMVRAALPALAEERSDIRIARALDEVAWPATARDLSVGASYLLPQQDLGGGFLLPYLQLIEATENGRLWITQDGQVKFLSRWDLGQPPYTTSVATFGQDDGDLHYVDLIVSQDLTFVRNEIRLTGIMEDAAEQVAQDPTSIRRYFTRALIASGLLVTDNELRDAADYLLARYAQSRLRFLTLELAPGLLDPVTQWPIVLGLEVSDRVTVKFTPPGQTIELVQDCFVEGISHNWTRAGAWKTTLALSAYGIGHQIYPEGKSFFVLGTSALGGNGVLVY